MRKVALHGSYFGYNFGDTLLCALFCHWIKSAAEAQVVLPLANRRNATLIDADYRGIVRFLSCTDLVFCGGGYFGDSGKNSLRWSIRNFFRHFLIAELAMLMRKDIYILGTGAGPLSSKFLRGRLRRLVNYSKFVIVRDEESENFLRQIGVTRPVAVDIDAATYMTRDILGSPNGTSTPTAAGLPHAERQKRVLVHLTNFGSPQWNAMADVLVEFFRSNSSERPVFITDSLSRTRRSTAQDKALDQLRQLIPESDQFSYSGNPIELCNLIDEVDLVITNKLHVGIVGVTLGKQIISLPQHVKTPRFYKQLGLSSVCITENQPEGLAQLLQIWKSGNLDRASLPPRTNRYLETLRAQLGSG
ncbi:hypothetical protein BVC93_04730 [Mycobacterium sp. MS1601]|uniref:polysaccharide pyruvyl transferase family protein n=1 Tax=Mycobacterium sp. MS1601 TaxID=1936029 RepID=UPI0009794BB9|nr:polysaccharide pyruvyl transferase family protein [Mycobacterium sp. MS1601]AQA01856.1 hypothetical protein BVC93_04730 [Mycobacterium sp. MS1601]